MVRQNPAASVPANPERENEIGTAAESRTKHSTETGAKKLFDMQQLINEAGLCALLQISKRHAAALRKKRLIPFIKLGKSVRFDETAVLAAVKKLTVKEVS